MILDTKDGFASFYALSLDQYEKKKILSGAIFI